MEPKNRFDRMEFMLSQGSSYTFIDLYHVVSNGTITGQHLWRYHWWASGQSISKIIKEISSKGWQVAFNVE